MSLGVSIKTIVVICVSGPNVNYWNLEKTLGSFFLRLNEKESHYAFLVDDIAHLKFIQNYFFINKKTEFLAYILNRKVSWAAGINQLITKFIDYYDYFLFSHDDLELLDFSGVEATLKRIQRNKLRVGWITFTSVGYYGGKRPVSNSVREGFFIDRLNAPYVFEFAHFLQTKLNTPKLPTRPVWAHAPYTHLNLISSASLNLVGPFPDWTEYTILLDEDQGLRALKHNLINVWIPTASYFHPLRKITRKISGLRYEKEAHIAFYKRWKISEPYSPKDVDIAIKNYGQHFCWSANRLSCDWKYL